MYAHSLGNTRNQVSALYIHLTLVANRVGRSDLNLDLFRGGLADEQAMVLAHELENRLIQLVTASTDGSVADDAGKRDYGNFRSSPANVDYHIAGGRIHRKTDADGSSHRLRDHHHFLGARTQCRVANGALLDLRDPGGNADDDPRLDPEHVVLDDEREEIPQHFLGHVEVGDNTVFHRSHRNDVFGRATEHALGLEAYALDLFGLAIERNDGRLVENDALAFDVDERVRRPQVNGDPGRREE